MTPGECSLPAHQCRRSGPSQLGEQGGCLLSAIPAAPALWWGMPPLAMAVLWFPVLGGDRNLGLELFLLNRDCLD